MQRNLELSSNTGTGCYIHLFINHKLPFLLFGCTLNRILMMALFYEVVCFFRMFVENKNEK